MHCQQNRCPRRAPRRRMPEGQGPHEAHLWRKPSHKPAKRDPRQVPRQIPPSTRASTNFPGVPGRRTRRNMRIAPPASPYGSEGWGFESLRAHIRNEALVSGNADRGLVVAGRSGRFSCHWPHWVPQRGFRISSADPDRVTVVTQATRLLTWPAAVATFTCGTPVRRAIRAAGVGAQRCVPASALGSSGRACCPGDAPPGRTCASWSGRRPGPGCEADARTGREDLR